MRARGRRHPRARGTEVVLALLGVVSLAAACGGRGSPTTTIGATTTTGATTTIGATTTTASATHAATCPLTGLPAPGGQVPQRPALAVKVDNAAAARPQFGLGTADVIYEQPVEGGLTRFIVIYQCRDAARVGPVRSGRLIDPELLSQFGAHPLFAFSGGIDATLAKIAASPLLDVGVNRAPSAYSRDPNRQAPHNLVSSTGALFAAGAARGASSEPPAPVFTYGRLPNHGPASAVRISYAGSELTWTWQSGSGEWLRSYAGSGPAALAEGGRLVTANVVVMRVVLYPSPYVEDPTGAHQNLLELTGSGPAQVFRDGAVVEGRWRRPSLGDKTELVDSSGQVIPLTPGQTWIELVPTTVNVTVTP